MPVRRAAFWVVVIPVSKRINSEIRCLPAWSCKNDLATFPSDLGLTDVADARCIEQN
jgi:hypothetical protein